MAREFELRSSPIRHVFPIDEHVVKGTWTPEITCNTPGDLSITYSANGQLGRYQRMYDVVDVWFFVATGVFTHSTASGFWFLQTLPYKSASSAGSFIAMGVGMIGNTTAAGFTYLAPRVSANSSLIGFAICNFADNAIDALAVSEIPTGKLPIFQGHVRYFTES